MGLGGLNNGMQAKIDAGKTKTLASQELSRLPGADSW